MPICSIKNRSDLSLTRAAAPASLAKPVALRARRTTGGLSWQAR